MDNRKASTTASWQIKKEVSQRTKSKQPGENQVTSSPRRQKTSKAVSTDEASRRPSQKRSRVQQQPAVAQEANPHRVELITTSGRVEGLHQQNSNIRKQVPQMVASPRGVMTTDGTEKRRGANAKKHGSQAGVAGLLSSMRLSNKSNGHQQTQLSAKGGVGAESQHSVSYDQHLLNRILARQETGQGRRGMGRKQPQLAIFDAAEDLPQVDVTEELSPPGQKQGKTSINRGGLNLVTPSGRPPNDGQFLGSIFSPSSKDCQRNKKTNIGGDRYKSSNLNHNRRLQDLCRTIGSSGVSAELQDTDFLEMGSDRTAAQRTGTAGTKLPQLSASLGTVTMQTGTNEGAARKKGGSKTGRHLAESVVSQESRRLGGQPSFGEAMAPTFKHTNFGGPSTVSNTIQNATRHRLDQTSHASQQIRTQEKRINTPEYQDESTSTDSFALNVLLAMNRRPFEPSVIPGSYRSKHPLSPEDDVDLSAMLEGSRQHLAEEEDVITQRKYRKQIGHEKAQLSFMELREGLQQARQQRGWKLRRDELQFKKELEKRLSEFQLNQKRVTVSRRRDVERLFAAKCRVVADRSGPSEAEIIRSLVGGASMLSGPLRELGKKILGRKGTIKPQTIHEKYQKVFDKYTLSPEELAEQMEAMAAQLRRVAPEIRPSSDLEALVTEDALQPREEINAFETDREILETARSDSGARGQPTYRGKISIASSRTKEVENRGLPGKVGEGPTVDGEGFTHSARDQFNNAEREVQQAGILREAGRHLSPMAGANLIRTEDGHNLQEQSSPGGRGQAIEGLTKAGRGNIPKRQLESMTRQSARPSQLYPPAGGSKVANTIIAGVFPGVKIKPNVRVSIKGDSTDAARSTLKVSLPSVPKVLRTPEVALSPTISATRNKPMNGTRDTQERASRAGSTVSKKNAEADAAVRAESGVPGHSPEDGKIQVRSSGDTLGSGLGSVADIEKRLQRYGKIQPKDKAALMQIFRDVSQDPEWFDESAMFELYQQRIPITEFMALLSADEEWSHMASKRQSEEVLDLFDKVYGYVKGLSRLEEQQKRYQKRIEAQNRAQARRRQCKLHHQHTPACQAGSGQPKAEARKAGMLNELFDVGKFLADKNMVERYSSHLNRVLIKATDSHVQAKHRLWLSQGQAEAEQLSFYERMQIDELMRESKAAQAVSNLTKAAAADEIEQESEEEDEEELEVRSPAERERHQRITRMAKSLKIPYSKAAIIDQMTASKGIQAATLGLDSEDEEWQMTPATAAATAGASELLSSIRDLTTKVFVADASSRAEAKSYSSERDRGASGAGAQVMLASARKGKPSGGATFTIAGLRSTPGKYMQGLLGDEQFDEYIVGEMRRYLEAKLAHGHRLSLKSHVKGLRHLPAGKQMAYRLKKREHDVTRHGHARAKSLATAKQLGPLRKVVAVLSEREDN